jgi:hypothetical protein
MLGGQDGRNEGTKSEIKLLDWAWGTMPLQSTIEESQLRWFGHVCHMNKEKYPKNGVAGNTKRETT